MSQARSSIEAESGIRHLLGAYSHACDDGRFDDLAALFTTDARFEVMGMAHEGRDAIRAFMAEAQPPSARGKHLTSNTVVDVADDARAASVVTDYVFVAPDRSSTAPEATMYTRFSITSVGRYHDEVVLDDDGAWRFARRVIEFLPVS